MNIDAYIQSGRMVASCYQKLAKRNKHLATAWIWCDTREVGGMYDQLEAWMQVICMEHEAEVVSFRMRKT